MGPGQTCKDVGLRDVETVADCQTAYEDLIRYAPEGFRYPANTAYRKTLKIFKIGTLTRHCGHHGNVVVLPSPGGSPGVPPGCSIQVGGKWENSLTL